jgi:[acyl-carrier-protein] S-malonyltransferase
MTIAFVFPGQGSQSPGMQADLAARYPAVEQTYAEASEVLGYDLWQFVQEGDGEALSKTTVTQPAMLAAGVAAYRAWLAAGGPPPAQAAGHSLGEYSALVAAGAVEFPAAMRIVKRRSELMQGAVPLGAGAMAAVLGLDDDAVHRVCAEAGGVAEPVNFNAPGQVVIAGETDAIERAIELAKQAGARRALPLPVSVPAHSSLMHPAGESLAETLAETEFEDPSYPVISAATGRPYADAADISAALSAQVYSPVLWVDTVRTLIDNGATRVVECGPGKVLAGLVRRIDKSLEVGTIDGIEGLEKALEA